MYAEVAPDRQYLSYPPSLLPSHTSEAFEAKHPNGRKLSSTYSWGMDVTQKLLLSYHYVPAYLGVRRYKQVTSPLQNMAARTSSATKCQHDIILCYTSMYDTFEKLFLYEFLWYDGILRLVADATLL